MKSAWGIMPLAEQCGSQSGICNVYACDWSGICSLVKCSKNVHELDNKITIKYYCQADF